MANMIFNLTHAPICCLVFNHKQQIIDCNQYALSLYHTDSKEALINAGFASLAPKYQLNGLLSASYAAQQLAFALKEGLVKCAWQGQTMTGKSFFADTTFVRITHQDSPTIVAYLREHCQHQEADNFIHQRLQAMLDSSPLACILFDESSNIIEVNQEVLNLFGLADKQECIKRFFDLSPEYQPDGRLSVEKKHKKLQLAFSIGRSRFKWLHQTLTGQQLPCEVTLVRVQLDGRPLVISYTNDLSEIRSLVDMKDHLKDIAFTDPLTNTYNRRYFMAEAAKELQKSLYHDYHFSIAMIDVDNYKAVNDTYGHPIGDEVLKVLVARIHSTLQHKSIVARYGGEEFVVMLATKSPAEALSIAEKIRIGIEEGCFIIDGFKIKVTVSIGVACKTTAAPNLKAIIKNADNALYQAKKAGRNQVILYDDAGDALARPVLS